MLEYFDAIKIGLSATPALHTVQIFGEPIFTYSFREAVVDGYLIDPEPPIRIETALTRAGITFQRDRGIGDEEWLCFELVALIAESPDGRHQWRAVMAVTASCSATSGKKLMR